MPATGLPIPHTSLSRPRMVPVDRLPSGAEVNLTRTPWQHICDTLVKNQGQWFELTRRYTALASAIASARKTLEADYPADIASRLESASLSGGKNGVTVYLRIAALPAEDPEEEDENGSLFPEEDGA